MGEGGGTGAEEVGTDEGVMSGVPGWLTEGEKHFTGSAAGGEDGGRWVGKKGKKSDVGRTTGSGESRVALGCMGSLRQASTWTAGAQGAKRSMTNLLLLMRRNEGCLLEAGKGYAPHDTHSSLEREHAGPALDGGFWFGDGGEGPGSAPCSVAVDEDEDDEPST